MSNPPAINFTIPYVTQAFRVVALANGVQPDGSNPGSPDTTSVLTISSLAGSQYYLAAIDPADNRRIIVEAIAPPPAENSVAQWSFKISVLGRPAFVTVSGTTKSPADVSGVTWDGQLIGPA